MNLENKLKEFEESCLLLASNDAAKLENEIREEIENQIKTEMEEYIQRKEWSFNKTIENLEKNYMKEVFNFQNECKKEILNEKKEIYKELKQEIIKVIKNYIETPEYKDYFLKTINQAVKFINDNEKCVLKITSKDLERYNDDILKIKKFEIEKLDDEYLGGCIIKSDSIFINNTILNSIEEKMID